jgi:hypothetical protein
MESDELEHHPELLPLVINTDRLKEYIVKQVDEIVTSEGLGFGFKYRSVRCARSSQGVINESTKDRTR